jgi:hypothetical protein
MLKSQRISQPFYRKANTFNKSSWADSFSEGKKVLENFSSNKSEQVLFVAGANLDLESIFILKQIANKYSVSLISEDYLNSGNNLLPLCKSNKLFSEILESDLCLTIGTNTRFEASLLNVRIRKRIKKGNFVRASIGLTDNLLYETLSIGNSLNTTSINSNNILMNSTSGYTTIYGGTNVARNTGTVANTFIEMFSGSPNAIIDFHSGGVVNNDFDSRITSFSGSSSTDPAVNNGKGLLELLASTVQIAGTLKMTEGKNITLQPTAGYIAPTQDTQLGGTRTGSIIGGTIINATTISSITLTTAGIYLITFGIYINVTTLNNINYIQMTGANTVVNNYGYSIGTTSSQIGYSGCQVVNATASTYTITMFTNSAYSTGQGGYFTATRIG